MKAMPIPQLSDFLCHVPALAYLSSEERQQVATYVQPLDLNAGESLFVAGQAYREQIFLLQQGDLRLHQEHHILHLYAGDFVGLLNALDGAPYASSAIAYSKVSLLQIPATRLQALASICPPLFQSLRRFISSQLHAQPPAHSLAARGLLLPARAVMKSPLVTCEDNLSLHAAYNLMHDRHIGSLGVTDTTGRLRSILTYQHLSEALLCQAHEHNTPLSRVALPTPLTVLPDCPLWQVEELQQEYRVKYVVVLEHGQPLGIISQTDLLRSVLTQQGMALTEVAQAGDFATLAHYFQSLPSIAREVWENNRRASFAVRQISEYHLAIQRRCIELVVAEFTQQHGIAPANYAFVIMGSGSRKEMLLAPDQDNGLIIEQATPLDASARDWFQQLAERVNTALAEVGYGLCSGDVMARNPSYAKTEHEWQQQISHIVQQPTPKAARWANVVFDFDCLYGDTRLVTRLQQWVLDQLAAKPRLLRLMVEDDAEGQAALGLFNRLVMTQKDQGGQGRIDIKRNGLRIIADAARIFALKYHIESRNTVERIEALVRQGVLPADFARFVYGAFDKSFDLVLRHQFAQLEQQQTLTQLIDPASFSPIHYEALRMSMRAIKQLQLRLQEEFDSVSF